MAPDSDPDLAVGVAIRIEGGRDVRILHARVRGYRIGIRFARHRLCTSGDFSYSWKPRLYSLIEHESLVDWLSFHHNERREWLRYGASIYLESVSGGEIRGNRAVQGMNGLMLTRSDRLRILDNDFSFNSGLGIGMYRSSDNAIHHNWLDFNVRGHSRFYHRGQDSADLLMFEQSSRNVVARNSATHGGDGVFLWAGQSTMDSGTGGCNDNYFYGNDFSYAPANGIEATFSRNTMAMNCAVGNDYGIWRLQLRLEDRRQHSATTASASRSSTARTTRSPRTGSTATPRRSVCGPIRSSPPTGIPEAQGHREPRLSHRAQPASSEPRGAAPDADRRPEFTDNPPVHVDSEAVHDTSTYLSRNNPLCRLARPAAGRGTRWRTEPRLALPGPACGHAQSSRADRSASSWTSGDLRLALVKLWPVLARRAAAARRAGPARSLARHRAAASHRSRPPPAQATMIIRPGRRFRRRLVSVLEYRGAERCRHAASDRREAAGALRVFALRARCRLDGEVLPGATAPTHARTPTRSPPSPAGDPYSLGTSLGWTTSGIGRR